MSEVKRAQLSTISTAPADRKKPNDKPKTLRFALTLPESNEKSCPEYNYRDLFNSAAKKAKIKEKSPVHPNGLNNLNPFGEDDDDDVKRIAKQFEEKYGIPNKNKKRDKKDDYADIGAGYDESDSFIDNTDAYDEMVPEDVTTLHGGFYINSGALEFKQVDLSGSESSDSDVSEKPVRRKRIIEDSEESESEIEKNEIKSEQAEKKLKIDEDVVPKVVKKKIPSDDKEKELAKKRKLETENTQKKKSITVKDLLRERREDLDMTIESDQAGKDPKSVVSNTPVVSSTINDVIESVINAGRVDVDEISKDSSSSEEAGAVSSDSESSRDGLPSLTVNDQLQLVKEPELVLVKLPDNLPDSVLEIVHNIKHAAENSEGKVKFFSDSVNNMFLHLEMQCRKLGKTIRAQIYEHLAPFVKCKKDTLMRRTKNLLLDQERNKVIEPLKRLKVLITNVMPIIIKKYEKECQKVRNEMFLANANANSDTNSAANKIRRMPKKKFTWTGESLKLLQEIVIIKRKCFNMEGIRKETFEDHLEAFLKTEVQPLWPEGWMSASALMKQVKIFIESQNPKLPMQTTPLSPISLDIQAPPVLPAALPFAHSPTKPMSLSPSCSTAASSLTVIPIPQTNTSPKSVNTQNGPKLKQQISPNNEFSAPVTKRPVEPSADLCTVTKECNSAVGSSLLIPSTNSSLTITSVDLRTNVNSKKDSVKKDEKPRVESASCTVIDLTDTPSVVRKPGPKSKTRYVDASKPKRVKEYVEASTNLQEEITGKQALNQLITGLTKYGSNSDVPKAVYKENAVNEEDMEQVMKDLKELQQLQEHARKNDIDIMAPSGSPVSVIAFNSSYSPTPSRVQANDLSKDRKSEGPGFQDVFQKHLFSDMSNLKQSHPSNIYYNSNVQPKSNYNSVNFSNATTGSISNSMNNIRYSQSSSKYTAPINHLATNPTGATNHSDDFALFQNYLYQYGFHNVSGSKQKSPP